MFEVSRTAMTHDVPHVVCRSHRAWSAYADYAGRPPRPLIWPSPSVPRPYRSGAGRTARLCGRPTCGIDPLPLGDASSRPPLNGAGHGSMSIAYRSSWGDTPPSGKLRGWRHTGSAGLSRSLPLRADALPGAHRRLASRAFSGLLIASHYLPHYAPQLRLAGLALTLVFGLVRTVLFWLPAVNRPCPIVAISLKGRPWGDSPSTGRSRLSRRADISPHPLTPANAGAQIIRLCASALRVS